MPDNDRIDLDSKDAFKLFQHTWDLAKDKQNAKNEKYLLAYQNYCSYMDMTNRDPYRSNLYFPKTYSTIETITPRLGKALFGSQPYMPIEAFREDEFSDNARAIQDALDQYLYRAKFEIKGRLALKMAALFGTSYLEPIPTRVMVEEKQVVPIIIGGVQVDQQVIDVQIPRFRFQIKLKAPWQVYPDPRATIETESLRFSIDIEVVSKKFIKEMIERGTFNEIDMERLTTSSGDPEKEWALKMLSGVGIMQPKTNDDMGVLSRLSMRDRVIYMWNGVDVLKDGPNPYKHGRINYVRFIDILDPLLQNSFHGRGIDKGFLMLADALNETWELTFDNHHLMNQGAWAYRDGVVEASHLVAVGGVRIKVAANHVGPLEEAVKAMSTPGLPRDHYMIPEVIEKWMDKSSGVFDLQRGEQAEGDPTATEISYLQQFGDMRSEEKVKILEIMGMAEFADLCMYHIDQFAGFDDLYDVIGERALILSGLTANAHKLPGGFDYKFKGSSSIIDDFKKSAEWERTHKMIAQSPFARPAEIERETLRKHQYSDAEIDKLILTDPEIQQMFQNQALAQEAELAQNPKLANNRPVEQPTIQNPGG